MADLQRIINETETQNELAAMSENFDIDEYINSRRQMIEDGLSYFMDQFGGNNQVSEAMRYSLFGRSKRARPILCLAVCEAFGGDTKNAVPAACALEMLHTYSLIHDDLPAMDNDDMRRGQPSNHIKFNEATAILAGDALQSMAFEIIGNTYLTCDALVDARRWLRVSSILGHGAGARGLVQGQNLDMESLRKKLTLAELEELSYHKTAVMFVVPLEIGAVLSYANEVDIMKMYEFGKYIGLAFQVMDDVLDIEEDRQFVANQDGTDNPVIKNTFGLLLGPEKARELALEYTDKALEVIEDFGPKFNTLREMANMLVNRRS